MYISALDYLCCPICQKELEVKESTEKQEWISHGSLLCRNGCGVYPIENGVPVLIPERCQESYDPIELQSLTRERFSSQWDMYRFGETTWGITVEERIPVVLHELDWQKEDLAGKVILDAGCGNGTLSLALAELGATVVAVDLSEGVFRAQQYCQHPNLHFAQANLFFPPLQEECFDAIYSCGVFHHTPDTKKCFEALLPTLKTEADARYFIWLYARRSALFNATVEPLMKITRRLPESLLVTLCHGLSPVVEGISRSLTGLGFCRFGPRTLRDRAIQLHDLLTPAYVWYHSYEEATGWTNGVHFREISETDYDPPAEQVSAQMRNLLDKYRSISRPGFGMLCCGPTTDNECDP